MASNRYNQNSGNYLIGMICLFAGLMLFCYSAYVLPYLMFGWHYSLPDFILNWASMMKTEYDFNRFYVGCIIFFSFFTPGLILFFIAGLISNHLESDLIEKPPEEEKIVLTRDSEKYKSLRLSLKMLGLLILVVIFVRLLEWVIAK